MGTDIHMACEVRRNGEWTLVTDKVFKNMYLSRLKRYLMLLAVVVSECKEVIM